MLQHFNDFIPVDLLKRVTVEGRSWLMAPSVLLPQRHPLQAYIPDVFIFLPVLTDNKFIIICPYCDSGDAINAKEFTRGRRILADGRCYWLIGRRYRCMACKKRVEAAREQAGGVDCCDSDSGRSSDDDDDDDDDVDSNDSRRGRRSSRPVNMRYSFANYHPKVLQRMGFSAERSLPCVVTHKLGLDKRVAYRLADPESNPADTMARDFNEHQRQMYDEIKLHAYQRNLRTKYRRGNRQQLVNYCVPEKFSEFDDVRRYNGRRITGQYLRDVRLKLHNAERLAKQRQIRGFLGRVWAIDVRCCTCRCCLRVLRMCVVCSWCARCVCVYANTRG